MSHLTLIRALALLPVLLAYPAIAAPLEAENVLVPLPPGFVLGYEAAKDGASIHEYVPTGETVDDWSTILTVQVFRGIAGTDPDAFAKMVADGWLGAYPDGTAAKAGGGKVNGYPMTLWDLTCPLNPATGKPETARLEAIGGADALYSVQYGYREAPSHQRASLAAKFLKAVSLCDTRKSDRACPAGM